jgi:3-oxoacyl-[acyl-carrier-protein] synthase III
MAAVSYLDRAGIRSKSVDLLIAAASQMNDAAPAEY